ncbi:MAG: hypothetical protein PHW50_02700 [Patescibacteria group bacterium]|nr:hypothetical protein [Patescibacteria group bacterium]
MNEEKENFDSSSELAPNADNIAALETEIFKFEMVPSDMTYHIKNKAVESLYNNYYLSPFATEKEKQKIIEILDKVVQSTTHHQETKNLAQKYLSQIDNS